MSLPDAWVKRLFDRFAAIYGVQKVGSMWAGANLEEVRQVWGDALGQYSGEVLGKSLQALEQTAGEWPPTLNQLVILCKSYNRPEQRVSLPPPDETAEQRAVGRANLEKIRAMLANATKVVA